MDKKKIPAVLLGIGTLITVILFSVSAAGKKPFQRLDASQIQFACVALTPPDTTLEIKDPQELTALLRETVIYGRDDSYTQYSGQGVQFTLVMKDGEKRTILAYSPFLVIDGVGYRTAHEPCQALNAYANRLLESGSAPVILEQPPVLDVVSDNTCVETLRGGYSWQKKGDDGSAEFVLADSLHPLDCKEMMTLLETTESTAVLRFQQEPDEILWVRCWSDDHWEEPETESEAVSWTGMEIHLKPGAYIYEVQAKWEPDNGYGGTANYSFYISTEG